MSNKIPRPHADEFFLLWVLIAQTRDALLKARQREYDQFNIQNEQRAVLWCVRNNGGQITPVEIARQLFRELNSVSEMLKRMEKQGLIIRQKQPGKKGLLVELTAKGQEVFNQSLHNEADIRILSVLSKKRRERLAADLWAIRNQALRELGIPEWHIKFPLNPSSTVH